MTHEVVDITLRTWLLDTCRIESSERLLTRGSPQIEETLCLISETGNNDGVSTLLDTSYFIFAGLINDPPDLGLLFKKKWLPIGLFHANGDVS